MKTIEQMSPDEALQLFVEEVNVANLEKPSFADHKERRRKALIIAWQIIEKQKQHIQNLQAIKLVR